MSLDTSTLKIVGEVKFITDQNCFTKTHFNFIKGQILDFFGKATVIEKDVGIFAVLVYAGVGLGSSDIGLWPIVLAHFVMTVWCGLTLLKRPA